MEILNEVEFNELNHNNISFDLNQLDVNDKKNYLLFYSVYRKIFIDYVIEKLKLKDYDMKVFLSELKFLPIEEDCMDVYQYLTKDYLKFFYVRNNFYVEKLNEVELRFLKERIGKNAFELDDELKKFIEETYRKIILEDLLENGEKCMTFYGPETIDYAAENDKIIIGFRYNEFNLNSLSDSEWNYLHERQIDFLDKIFQEIENNNNLVKVIKYNDLSFIES